MSYNPNSPNEISKRKSEGMLKLYAAGIVIFALWDAVKFFMQLITGEFVELEAESKEIQIFVMALVFIVMFIDAWIRIFIWRNAAKECNGEKPRNAHIVLATILVILDFVFLIAGSVAEYESGITLQYIIETIITLTSELVLLETVIETFKLRKIKKLIAEEA